MNFDTQFFNVIISFHEGIKAAVIFYDSFNITNDTKHGCVMDAVFFAFFFSVMLIYAFGDRDARFKF